MSYVNELQIIAFILWLEVVTVQTLTATLEFTVQSDSSEATALGNALTNNATYTTNNIFSEAFQNATIAHNQNVNASGGSQSDQLDLADFNIPQVQPSVQTPTAASGVVFTNPATGTTISIPAPIVVL
jgi:hypothetical protein